MNLEIQKIKFKTKILFILSLYLQNDCLRNQSMESSLSSLNRLSEFGGANLLDK